LLDILEACKISGYCVDHHRDVQGYEHIEHTSEIALGMGRRSVRRSVASQFLSAWKWATLIHPSAVVSPSATIEWGAQIMAGAIIQAGAKIGKHAIINTGAQVDHGCVIGDFAHICPGAILCADVTVLEGGMVDPGVAVTRGSKALHFKPPMQHYHSP
jgi:UDP-3-O-[3-hydroxymyristoyl] glucosamine N-acyltransferase